MKNRYAEIAIPGGPDILLTYEIPGWLSDKIRPGKRVVVPFRKTHTVGVVIKLRPDTPIERTRYISDCPDDTPVFSPAMLKLIMWLSDYYASSPGDAFRAALPGGIGVDVERIIAIRNLELDNAGLPKKAAIILELLRQHGDIPEKTLKKKVGSSGFYAALDEIISRGIAGIRLDIKKTRKPRTVAVVSTAASPAELARELDSLSTNAVKQKALLDYLLNHSEEEHIRRELSKKFGAGPVKSALDKGWIIQKDREIYRRPNIADKLSPPPPPGELTKAQNNAIKKISKSIKNKGFHSFVLWGITGSGKTEVYLNAAQKAKNKGEGVLVLVPEIALTPQLWGRFEQRFPEQVAVLHSGLRPGERFDAWRKLASGELTIAIGPRSAVFAPVKNLGLIVVDEEHETSYKQEEPPPYYNARDVAVMRASIEKCPVVLGTATPSAETYYNALEGKYELLELPERIPGAELPGVRIVDMVEEREENKNYTAFSRLLSEKLVETISKGHRAMLLLNRRGFSSYLQCPDCGYIPTCEACGVGYTYHRVDAKLRCHYCGAEIPAFDTCPECGSKDIKYRGMGTQRIEKELTEIVPPERIFRLDTDAARTHGYAKVIKEFLKNPGSVLVGTQMIAKGHDFPDVALVGVLNADIGLIIPDFRSGERIFQLLTQVSGRAGRSKIRGEVIIQTYRPDSPAIDFAVNGDVVSFFESELAARKELFYPPFGRMVRVLAHCQDPGEVRNSIFRLTRELARIDRDGNKYRLLGPASCPISKIRGEYRWHLLMKTNRLKTSVKIVKRIISNWGSKVSYKIVVDPLSLL